MTEASIFMAALDKGTEAERAAFLAEACDGDERLRRRIEALLRAHAEPDDILDPKEDRPDLAWSTIPALANGDPAGAIVNGRYKLLELIGEGGMGAVWMAEQRDPVKRLVALKLIKPGMDSKAVLARFEAERQALALMDHPNIARILDGGTTRDEPGGVGPGRPYFIMELVKGRPLTDYCDARQMSIKARLELFVRLCSAVQHAHQKGIIHRDLKPSNLLVTEHDGEPVPKVIDFGLAKALNPAGALTDRTLYTAFGTVVGTPLYMAPEQVGINALDVDTRSDIYALGVVLYELLTGSTPLSKERVKRSPWEEVRRVIQEEEPPRPSTRLSSSHALPSLAASRRTEPAKLAKLVRGELDWIVMKALEKDRGRRYQTANGLARDIQRYLADEPVEACPPSAAYRLHKFARKYRRFLVTAGAFVLLLAAAALASTWQAIRATLAETKARHAQEAAERERRQAVTNLYHARVEQAAALRRARGMGYRTQVFSLLQQALQLDTPDKDIDRLRDEAVACLGDFVGLEPITWEDFPETSQIQTIALTPEGEHMAVALDDGAVQVRDVRTGGVLAQLSESAVALGVDPANRWLVTAGATGTIKVWQDYGAARLAAAQTIEMRAALAGIARNGRFAVAYSHQKDGGLLSLWDVARQEVTARLNVPSAEPVETVQVSDDGQWVAMASARESKLYALVWNAPVPEPREIFFAETHQDTRALSISPDGRLLACQHGDDGLILLDVRTGVPRPLIRTDEVQAACFSQDSRFLVFICGSVRLWNVSHHQEVAVLAQPKEGGIPSATISADGSTFATADRRSRSIRIWKLAGSGEKLVLTGHEGGVPSLAFSPDGKVLASASKDRLVKLWDSASGRLLRTLPRFESSIQSVAFSPDGRLLATGQFGPTAQPVHIWDLATLQAFAPPGDDLGQAAYSVAFSPDSKFFAACGHGLTIWRHSDGEKRPGNAPRLSFERMAHLPGYRSLYLCISPDSKLLAWTDHNYLPCVWDLANGRELPFLGPRLLDGWGGLVFYPDSDHLTLPSATGTVDTWDVRTVRRVSSWGKGVALAVCPGDRCLMGPDQTLWSSQKRSRIFSFPQESGPIWCTTLSPNGERVAVGLADGRLAIWSVPRIQAQLEHIGLAWRADSGPQQQQPEPEPFVLATLADRKHEVTQRSNLGKRLAWVGRAAAAEEAYRGALKVKPVDPVAHGNFGKFLEDEARYEEAEAELNEAIHLEPEQSWFWVLRGWVYADREQWQQASADFAKATECKNPDEDAWNSLALLYLRDGELDGYRKTCSDMLERFGAGAVWTCTLAPDSGTDAGRNVSLAEKAPAKSPRDPWQVKLNHWYINQLGVALYRAGRFEEAVKRLTEAVQLDAGAYRTNMLYTWFFLAMAHHRLGHAEEARHWLDKAIEASDEALRPPAEPPGKSATSNGVIRPNWSRRLTLETLRREAGQLIQAPATKPVK